MPPALVDVGPSRQLRLINGAVWGVLRGMRLTITMENNNNNIMMGPAVLATIMKAMLVELVMGEGERVTTLTPTMEMLTRTSRGKRLKRSALASESTRCSISY